MTDRYAPTNLRLWTRPDHYVGASWPDHYVFLKQHRDSDTLTRSNFRSALKALGGETDTVLVVNEGHWAVGWVEWIAIHKDDHGALRKADEIMDSLEDYPVVNEEDWSELETEEANEVWAQCYSDRDRLDYIRRYRDQFDFHDYGDLIAQARGRYFGGYASELLA